MRKYLVAIVFSGFSLMALAQNKPEYGNWNIGGGLGLIFEQGISQSTPFLNLYVEKHYNPYFSLKYYNSIIPDQTIFANLFSINPTLNLRSNGRFVFSLGMRAFILFPYNFYYSDFTIFGLNHQFKFRFLLGNRKVYRREFKGEINVTFEPIYFREINDNRFGTFQFMTVNYVLPLFK